MAWKNRHLGSAPIVTMALSGVVTSAVAIGSIGASGAVEPGPAVAQQVDRAIRDVRVRTPAPGELIRVRAMHGRQHLWCRGAPSAPGEPTIVVVSGAGDFSLSWRGVQRRLSDTHRVCTYDRAGLGWSSAVTTARTGRQIVPQLDRLLRAGGIRGPLVMVGHSMGGIYARMFADRHPGRVRGMVLVDAGAERLDVDISSPARQALRTGVHEAAARQLDGGRTCATGAYARDLSLLPLDTVFPLRDARIERRLTAGWCRIWRTNAAEGRGANRTWSQARALGMGRNSLGDRPLGIIVSDADLTFVEDPALNANIVTTWRRLQRQQAQLSALHRFRVARDSSHAVMLDRPSQVAATIRWTMAHLDGDRSTS